MKKRVVALVGLALALLGSPRLAAQLGSRPVEEWVKTLDGPTRVAALKIDQVVSALKIQPGQTVADIGAGTGLLEVALARATGPKGRVFAEDIDAGFFPIIQKRAADGQVANVQTVLGTFTDPRLPVKSVDLVLFHDVLHHIENRGAYLKTIVGYLGPAGRVAVADYEAGRGPHPTDPALQVSREQLGAFMSAAGLTKTDDVKLFSDKYVLIYSRQGRN
jgi:ubiquinone/menaquinone biosynthesis C-methylase UbiE